MDREKAFLKILQERRIAEEELAELDAEYHSQVYEEWSSYLRELGLPENCGLYEA